MNNQRSAVFVFVWFLFFCSAGSYAQTDTPIAADLTIKKNLSDNQLLDLVQKQTFRYFWDFAHPVSGMARERNTTSKNFGDNVVTTGGTGFGIMATIVAANRKFIPSERSRGTYAEDCEFSIKGRPVSWRLSTLVKWRNG